LNNPTLVGISRMLVPGVSPTMQVFIAGATGVLGRRLVELLAGRGHDVVGLTRDERGDALVRARGGRPHRGDVLDRPSLVDAASGCDVLVHAATKVPLDANPGEAAWATNDRVRRDGAANLVAAAAAVGAERVVLQSVVWVARQPDGRAFDEDAPPNPDRATQSALDAERVLEAGAGEHGFDHVVCRAGWFYAPDAAHTRELGERLLARRFPVVGRGPLGRRDATLSFVHVDDAASAFASAVEGDATGTFHVVDDEPTTFAAFLERFAEELHAPTPLRLPAWVLRPVLDANTLRLLTTSMPTSNERFREAFDWTPRYPSVDVGLEQVVETWRADGTLDETTGGVAWHAA
jgi:nucleoside-diphosphate-sugar epimerase